MSWQLWVVVALAAVGLVLLTVARIRHARQVFDDITEPDRRPKAHEPEPDELAPPRPPHQPQTPPATPPTANPPPRQPPQGHPPQGHRRPGDRPPGDPPPAAR